MLNCGADSSKFLVSSRPSKGILKQTAYLASETNSLQINTEFGMNVFLKLSKTINFNKSASQIEPESSYMYRLFAAIIQMQWYFCFVLFWFGLYFSLLFGWKIMCKRLAEMLFATINAQRTENKKKKKKTKNVILCVSIAVCVVHARLP